MFECWPRILSFRPGAVFLSSDGLSIYILRSHSKERKEEERVEKTAVRWARKSHRITLGRPLINWLQQQSEWLLASRILAIRTRLQRYMLSNQRQRLVQCTQKCIFLVRGCVNTAFVLFWRSHNLFIFELSDMKSRNIEMRVTSAFIIRLLALLSIFHPSPTAMRSSPLLTHIPPSAPCSINHPKNCRCRLSMQPRHKTRERWIDIEAERESKLISLPGCQTKSCWFSQKVALSKTAENCKDSLTMPNPPAKSNKSPARLRAKSLVAWTMSVLR